MPQPEGFRTHILNHYTRVARARLPIPPGQESHSHFNDEYAQSLGYRKATVGGGVIRNRVLLAVAEAWGLPWFERGGFFMRFRQPLFDGDDVVVSFSPVRDEEGASRTDFQVVNADGVACVVGWVALPRTAPPAPALAEFPRTPLPSQLPSVLDGEKLVGERLASEEVRVPEGLAATLRSGHFNAAEGPDLESQLLTIHAALHATCPELREQTVVAPWVVVGGLRGLDFTGSRFASATEWREQLFHLASVDDPLSIHSRVSGAFERKGSRYLATEHLIVARDRTPIAWREITAVTQLARATRPDSEEA